MNEPAIMPETACWIGGEAPETVQLFRREFRLEEEAASALLQITADQRYRLRVNGMWFGDGPEGARPGRWTADRFELSSLLRTGANFIEVQVIPPDPAGSRAALAAAFTVTSPDGRPLFQCVTDETWSAQSLPALTLRRELEIFDAAQLPGERRPARRLSRVGEAPWGALHHRAVAPLTRIERLFRSARGSGNVGDPEALLYPDDRCTLLQQQGDAVCAAIGETVNGCWNAVLRTAAGNAIEFYLDHAETPAARFVSKGGWQRFTTVRPRRTAAVTLKLAGPGPAEIQSLRLVEAAYPAVLRSSFASSDAREERRWEAESAALARRLGRNVDESAELPDLVTAAARVFGAADWAVEELSRQLFAAPERPPEERLPVLLAAARFLERYGAPGCADAWRVRAEELLHELLELPENTLTLAGEFQLCGLLKCWRMDPVADAVSNRLAASWNPLRLAFCRSGKEPRETAIRANLHALAADAVPAPHLASLRAEAAALTAAEELLIAPELPANLGCIEAVLAALPEGSGRAPLYQLEFLLGVRFHQEGTRCTFSPWIGRETQASGKIFTRFGEVLARWRKLDRSLTAEIALPKEIRAEFLPNPSLAGLSMEFRQLSPAEWERTAW